MRSTAYVARQSAPQRNEEPWELVNTYSRTHLALAMSSNASAAIRRVGSVEERVWTIETFAQVAEKREALLSLVPGPGTAMAVLSATTRFSFCNWLSNSQRYCSLPRGA